MRVLAEEKKDKSDPKTRQQEQQESFDWVQLRTELDRNQDTGEMHREKITTVDKFKRKFAENPFIPIGCGLTTLCLITGLGFFAKKRSDMSQIMMRGRILAQGFTIAGLVGGIFYNMRVK